MPQAIQLHLPDRRHASMSQRPTASEAEIDAALDARARRRRPLARRVRWLSAPQCSARFVDACSR